MQVLSLGEPLKIENVNLSGVAAGAGRGGETIPVWTRLTLTSDDALFHRIVPELASVLVARAASAGANIRISSADMVIAVIHDDQTADLWVDTAAITMNAFMRRGVEPGSPIFESDIVDIIGLSFPQVPIGPSDGVICIMKVDWRFALYFDFNPEGDFQRERMERILGSLHRTLRYKHLYDALADETFLARLFDSGWFPFAEILNSEFKKISSHCESEFDLTDVEGEVLLNFDQARLDRLLERWLHKPHFLKRERMLRAALASFAAREPIGVIKIILTEIEGILADAYRARHGQSAKLNTLLEFAKSSAAEKVGGDSTLLMPNAFGRYLAQQTFANFDPVAESGNASSRHAVGHGAAKPESYTMTRALQAILTLDQLAFYT